MSERTLRQKLVQHAEDLLDDMKSKGATVPVTDRIEALKAITTLDLGIEKHSGKVPEDDGGWSMRVLARQINGVKPDA